MKYQVPDDDIERLNQLNKWFTEILCSPDYYDDDKWLSIRLNITKWKQKGFGFRYENVTDAASWDQNEKALAYKIYNYLSEVILFDMGIREAVLKQRFEQASLYRDLSLLSKQHLQEIYAEEPVIIPFFKMGKESLALCHIENYFINQYIKERIRK